MRRSLWILPGLLVLLAACGDDAAGPGGLQVRVAPGEATPFTDELSAWEAGGPGRPVGAVRDGDRQSAFVENEVLIATADADALDAFVARWNGEVVDSFDPAEEGLEGLPPQHVVRIDPDPDAASAPSLEADLAELAPEAEGEVVFSSETGLRTFAVVAAESRTGELEADVSWIARPFTFTDYATEEAPRDDGSYRDAFNMKHLRSGGAQDIGVDEAWIALERAGRLENRVQLGVIDGGFSENADTTGDRSWSHVAIRSSANIGTPNPTSCSGGNPCRWHGTNVVHAAAGNADNRFGSAGPAGPVADVHMRHTSLDHGKVKRALASLGRADIVNMSFGGSIASFWDFTISGYRSYVSDVARRKLVFAAAGNDGDDMDDDRTNHPCEFGPVICVGALGDGSSDAAGFSNHGARVDLWAPGSAVRVGPDPDSDGAGTQLKFGTSTASPFAAGVAALIMAADPSLSRDAVEARLLDNAHTGSSDAKVDRWVDARAAVMASLPDSPPQVYIERPMDDESFDEGATVEYSAIIDDLDDPTGDLSVRWSHTTDDVLYSMGSTMPGEILEDSSLCAGSYVIDAEVSGGIADSVTVHFAPLPDDEAPAHCAPPPEEVVIDSPTDGSTFVEGATVPLSATVSPTPPAFSIIWREGGPSGRILGMGTDPSTRFGAGTHTLWVGYGDASDSVTIEVVATANTAPSVTITAPPDGEHIVDYSTPPEVAVDFTASVSDAEDGSLGGSSVEWSYRKVGTTTWRSAGVTGTDVTIDLADDSCDFTDYEVKAIATDSGGLNGEDAVSVAITAFGC